MTAKQRLLAFLVGRDASGTAQRLHDTLVSMGFKWKDRSGTMMYFARGRDGAELGLLAMRPGLVSFPRNFWGLRPQALAAAMNSLPANQHIRLEDGPFTSSQYSAGQLALDNRTEVDIVRAIREFVIPEARRAGARL
jgi:hypothetical protein